MRKETITYTDYNGNTRTEDFYFNLNKSEILKMQLSVNGGYAEMAQRLIQAENVPELMKIWEELIQKSYGVKTPDGKGFVKRPADLEAFMFTEAYSELYMKLATNTEAATAFFNGIFPADLVAEANAQAQKQALASAT